MYAKLMWQNNQLVDGGHFEVEVQGRRHVCESVLWTNKCSVIVGRSICPAKKSQIGELKNMGRNRCLNGVYFI